MIDRLLCSIVLFVITAFAASAQETASEPGTAAAAKEPAGLRAWIFPAGGEPLTVGCRTAGDEQPRTLATAAGDQRSITEGYENFPAGRVELQLKAGEKVLATAAGSLADGRAYTAIALREGGDWKIRVLADGPPKTPGAPRPLRVCNFPGGRETLLSVQGAAESKIAGDSLQEFEVAPGVTLLSVKVLAPDGDAPAQSSTEVDFSLLPSAYLVISPDYRGRMRPRVIVGGQMGEPLAAAAESAGEGQP
jgi:hypothetical protein